MMLHYGVHPARNPESSRDPLEEWQAEQLIRNGGNGIVDIFFIIAGFVSTRPTAQVPADVRSFERNAKAMATTRTIILCCLGVHPRPQVRCVASVGYR